MHPFRLTLADTAAPDRPGSMRRYAELVQQALQTLPAETRPAVTLVSLSGLLPACLRSSPRLANWLHHAACALRVRGRVQPTQPDLVHVLDGSHAYVANLLPRRLPVVTTVHDLIPVLTERGELPGPRPSRLARCLWRLSLRGTVRCGGVVAVSEHTRRDLVRLARPDPTRVAVVHNAVRGCDVRRSQAGDDGGRIPAVKPSPSPLLSPVIPTGPEGGRGSARPFILHLGNNAAYKNREGVLRVGALVLQEYPVRLVLAGPAPTEGLRCLAEDLGIAEHVEWRIDVGDSELQDLYREAGVFLFPSLYEGFGWPPLEAMACGCPVVCSNAASLPEVVGDAALLAAPGDHAALARHCCNVLSSPELRATLFERGYANTTRFTLDRFAAGLLAVYRGALGLG